MASLFAVFVAMCLIILLPVAIAQEGSDFGMAGFDDPPSTTPESSTVVAEPDIPPEDTTTEATTTAETTTVETTTVETTTEAITTKVITTDDTTTLEPSTTQFVTTEDTTPVVEFTTTESTTLQATTTEETTPQATTIEEIATTVETTTDATTEEATTSFTTLETTTTEVTDATPTEAVATSSESEQTTEYQTTVATEVIGTEGAGLEATTTEETTTVAESVTTEASLTTSTDANVTDSMTTASAVKVPEIEIFDVSTEESNITTHTHSLIHQISTTPLSANVTIEISTPSKPEKLEPPSIAVGIDTSIFDLAVPIVHHDKTTPATTTESTEVTTPPDMNTTMYEEVTTREMVYTTEAAVLPKPAQMRPIEPPAPDHPPPIIFVPQPKGRIPEVVPPYHGFKPVVDQRKPIRPVTEAPPPPIFIPEMPMIRPAKPRFQSPFQPARKQISDTVVSGFKYKEPAKQDRRHLSIDELTRLAFEQITRALNQPKRAYSGPRYSKGAGLQQFFKPAVPITRRPPTITTVATTTTRQFMNKFKVPADRRLTKSRPWQNTAGNTWTGLKFDLPGGSNVLNKGGLWPSVGKSVTTSTQRPRVNMQPAPSTDLISMSEISRLTQKGLNVDLPTNVLGADGIWPSPAKSLEPAQPSRQQTFQPAAFQTLIAKNRPINQPHQRFDMPKGGTSSNIWGSNDLWGHIQRTATTTARPTLQARPLVPPPTFNTFEKPISFWTRPSAPQERSERRNTPNYNIFGQQESPKKRTTEIQVQPMPQTNQILKMPGLWNLMTQKHAPPVESADVKSIWKAPSAVPLKPVTVSDKHKRTQTDVKDVHPLKDLRASQHDIRFYNKPHSHQFFKPSISTAQGHMQDLFLKASLAGSRSRKPQMKTSRTTTTSRPAQFRIATYGTTTTRPLQFQQRPIFKQERRTTPIEHKTTLYKHKTTPYEHKPTHKHRTTPYRQKPLTHEVKTIGEKRRTTPLTFEELLLRQLKGDASLFDMRRWSSRQVEQKPTQKTGSSRQSRVEESRKTVPEMQKQLPSTTSMPTYTERKTTPRVPKGPTTPPIAAEHPPPIFDSKVFRTFMPFPKDEPSSKDSSSSKTKNLKGTSEIKPFGDPNDHGTCKGCTFVNDRCLLPDPVHCNRYIECVRQGPANRVFTRECALGSFFDRKSFLCVDPKNADCPTDRCREEGLKSYIIHGHCMHYWVCGSRKGGGIFAQAECCPEGGGFVEGIGCVAMENCTESCDHSKIEDKIIGCRLRKTASPREYYDENANVVRPCAPGTLFSEPKCTCIQDVTVEHREVAPEGPTCECSNGIPVLSEGNCSCREPTALEKLKAEASVCSPVLNMTFDGGKIEDKSTTRQHVGTQDIAASAAGELTMTAKGRVILWRYSNLVFSDIFSVRLRFKPSQSGPRYQTILSNCDPESGSEPSISISLDTQYHEVIFTVNTYQSASKKIKIYYQTNKWSTVFLIYDGERIVAAVDGRVRNIFAGGRIETRPYPIGLGSCGTKVGLHGLIDDVAFFEDCISDDMYGVFLNVLE